MAKASRRPGDESKRRGRKPRPANQGQRVSLGLKVTPDIKNKLDALARANGRTQSQEAEVRLEQSFRDQQRAELFSDLYYGRELSALLEIVGRAIRDAGTHAAVVAAMAGLGSYDWIDNPFGFDAAIKAAVRVLENLRPPGEIAVPKPKFPAQGMLGEAIADGLLSAVKHPPDDFRGEWARPIGSRLGRLYDRLDDANQIVRAFSAILPTANAAGLLLYDSDDRKLLEETSGDDEGRIFDTHSIGRSLQSGEKKEGDQ